MSSRSVSSCWPNRATSPANSSRPRPRKDSSATLNDSKGTCSIIDLDLSRYDKLAKRFEVERQNDLSFLKQGIETKNKAFNKLIETIERVAVRSSDPILLTGPTGAGKSQLANQIFKLNMLKTRSPGSATRPVRVRLRMRLTFSNDSDRLTKFLARFGLKFKKIVRA